MARRSAYRSLIDSSIVAGAGSRGLSSRGRRSVSQTPDRGPWLQVGWKLAVVFGWSAFVCYVRSTEAGFIAAQYHVTCRKGPAIGPYFVNGVE